ncbi:MAG: hypothetical protein HYU66_20760, partial [Armatimonadetes bacterium]|nr:hypothetical protein [Armatimonadota bacterium]
MSPLCLFVATLAAIPDMVAPADTRADRGDVPGSPHITGPTSPIHRFYNDDVEISFWHGPGAMTFDFAKNDVWDRRYLAANKRPITLDDVHRVCFGDEQAVAHLRNPNGPHGSDLGLPNAPHALYLAYDFPCPKPVGQLILRCSELDAQPTWRAGPAGADTLAVHATAGGAKAGVWAFLHRTRNLFVVRGEYAGLTAPLEIQLYRHRDTTPEHTSVAGLAHFGGDTGYDYSRDRDNGPLPDPTAGADGRCFWIRQRFAADPTFPHGFESVLMGRLTGMPYDTKAADGVAGAGVKATIHPLTDETRNDVVGWLKELRLAAERVNDSPGGALATATIRAPAPQFTLYLAVVTTRDAADPLAAARRLLAEAADKGEQAALGDSLSATRAQLHDWRLSRVMHYNATSCTWADATPWHGDYHFNEGWYTDTIVSGGSDELEQRLRMFEEMLPALRRNAREVYGCRGLAFSLVHYPIRAERVVYSNVVWEWGLENTALMLQPFWQTFEYTWDRDFLRRRAYPMMREGARFYADYVKRGDDGFRHVVPTVSQEHWGFTPQYRLNRDSVGALSFIRYHLQASVQAAEILGVDAAERAQWAAIADRLARYPTLDTPAGPVFCDVRDAPEILEYNITANLVMSLWTEGIGLDSPADQLALARRSYAAIPLKERSPRPGYLRQIELNLGLLEQPYLSPQGRVLSWPGRIHLYAGVPAGVALTDHFERLRAVGGFEVSAAHAGTEVQRLRIRSLAGHLCRVKSPWPAGDVEVVEWPSRKPVPHRAEGDTLTFPTRPGTTYALLAGPERAEARRRSETAEKLLGRWVFTGRGGGSGPTAKLVGPAALRDGLALNGEAAYARVERQAAFDFAAGESFAIEIEFRVPAGLPPTIVPLVCSMAERQYCLTLHDGRASLYLSSPNGAVWCRVLGETSLTDGRWHTLRAVRDAAAGELRMTVDGRLEGTAADLTTGDFASTAPLTIGAYLWGEHTRY